MLNLVFLPATEPGNETFGTIPERIDAYSAVSVRQIRYPTMVWYNKPVRMEAIAQIRSLDVASVTLVGFSKSGLGVWNIVRTIPNCISSAIIFDAPVAREVRPEWGTAPFYEDDVSWLQGLPIRTVEDFQAVAPRTLKLVLISGEMFHKDMSMLARALSNTTVSHVFLPRPDLKHHWQSGWIEEGLNILLEQPEQFILDVGRAKQEDKHE